MLIFIPVKHPIRSIQICASCAVHVDYIKLIEEYAIFAGVAVKNWQDLGNYI